MITRDCPVGTARVRRKVALAALACLAFGMMFVFGLAGREKRKYDVEDLANDLRSKPVIGPIVEHFYPVPTSPFKLLPGEIVMGVSAYTESVPKSSPFDPPTSP